MAKERSRQYHMAVCFLGMEREILLLNPSFPALCQQNQFMGCDIDGLIFLLLLWRATNTRKAIKQKQECRCSLLKLPAIGCHTDSIISLCALCCRHSQIRARRLNIFCVFQEHLLAYHQLRTNLPNPIRNASNTRLYQEPRHVAGAQRCLEACSFCHDIPASEIQQAGKGLQSDQWYRTGFVRGAM